MGRHSHPLLHGAGGDNSVLQVKVARLTAPQQNKVLGVDVAGYRDGHLSFLQGNLLCGWHSAVQKKRHLTHSLFIPREFIIGSPGFPAHCCPENFSCFRHVSN